MVYCFEKVILIIFLIIFFSTLRFNDFWQQIRFLDMSILPINNFEEHLARFTAARKSISSNSNPPEPNKKFTFKKSLSLGKSNEVSNHNSKLPSKSAVNKTADHEEIQVDLIVQSNPPSDFSKKGAFKNNQPQNTLNFNDHQKKVSPDIRNYFNSGESNIQNKSDFTSIKDEIGDLIIVKETNKNFVTSTKSERNVHNSHEAKPKENKRNRAEWNEGKNPNFSSKIHEKNILGIDSPDLQNNEQRYLESNSPIVLKEANFKIMTRICDILENQEDILLKNKDINNLILLRRKILHRQSVSENEIHSKTETLSTSNFNDVIDVIDDDDDFIISPNSSISTAKSCSKSDDPFTPVRESSSTKVSELCKLDSPFFVTAKSLVCSASSSKRNSFETNGFLNESSFENQSSKCKTNFDSTIDLDDIGAEDIDTDFSDLEEEKSSKWGTQKNPGFEDKSKDKIIAGKFYGNQRDDGATSQFKGFKFPFSSNVMQTFQNVFGLKKFRHNQLEAINASLLGEDCFVLMPTGGGKSLCYQLPALVSSGVTIVISPLRSLILDQVQKLCSLDIPASSLTGDADTSTTNHVYSQLASREPSIKLLYVTPEKVIASAKLVSCIENLYSRNQIQRFVIDEAHCVSQWGHDFRPDYKRLKILREKFSKVPLMALTATATPRVRGDVLHQLGMKSPKWFLQSFNRPNLKYEVRPKTKSVVADIIELLKSKFRNMCGIVYCLSRNDCDTVADILRNNGIRAASYHAGLNNRAEIQEQWINDKFKVICATIAFGMGIDKPDVRFVIHHAIPKSIEGYYQESGRAGRDGERSWCILYYCYRDMQRFKRMIMQDKANKHSWSQHFDNLYKMVHYCENKTDCRRVWMLGYFGEIFDRKLCLNYPETSCDNCFSKEEFTECDLTEDAKAILQCVAKLVDKQKNKNFTLTYFVDIYKGAKIQRLLAAGHNKLELFGKGQSLHRCDAERLLRKLVLEQYLQEDMVINKMDLPHTYIYVGKRAKELLSGKAKVVLSFQKSKGKHPQSAAPSIEDKEIQELVERCYNQLIEVSKDIATERNMHYTNVINVEALRQMSREMPMTEEDMLMIPHVTHAVFEKYGKRFLEVTQRYAAERCVIDAERADQEMLSACVEQIDDWSDVEASTSKGPVKRGVKRKASRGAVGKTTKKQKNFFTRKRETRKGKAKGGYRPHFENKKTTTSEKRILKVPGFMPNPKTSVKPAVRSFLPTPKLVLK